MDGSFSLWAPQHLLCGSLSVLISTLWRAARPLKGPFSIASSGFPSLFPSPVLSLVVSSLSPLVVCHFWRSDFASVR